MSEQSNAASRIVRWGAVAALIALSIGLYFRFGTHLPPLNAASLSVGAGEGTAPSEPKP